MSNPSDQTQKSVLGPFTKETFNQIRWKQIKDKIIAINSTNEEEALPDVRLFLQFLTELNEHPDYNKYFGETSIKNFFFDEILPLNAKNLIACKYFNNNELLEISNACLKQMILFWYKTLHEDHPKLGEMAKVILDPSRTYFKYNNQETLPSSVTSGFLYEPTIQHLEWIQTLKEGDLVDCIKIDQTYKKMCWSQAKVAYVMDPHIKVTFLNDHEKTSRYLEKKANAHEIAPHKTKCTDFDFRLNLKVGDELDACDTTHVWYNATILDIRETPLDDGTIVKDLYIGYRVYTPDGDRQDSEGKKFNGWSSKYDEWLSWTDPRLAQKNTMAKKLYMGSSSNSEDPVVDDSNDKIYNQEGKKLFVIIRSNHSKSTFLINLVNQFGEMGGFERIYERITDTKNWVPIETVSVLCSVIGNLSPILHRDFALEYIPRFKEAVWRSLLYGPESNVRNFTKDKIEGIIQAFDALLKRVYSLPEKQEIIESFNLQICCVCFDSAFLERKLQGLKALLQVIKDIRYQSSNQAKFITNSYLNGFLSRNNIFTKIYGSKGHVQLIQRSAEFLKYMLHEDILNQEDFQTIWTATTKGDMEAKLAVYKVLSEISLHLKSGHLDHIITKIAEIQSQEVIAEEIDLVYELCKFSIKPAWFIKKARDFYWQIISDSSGLYASNIVELTLNKFCEIMRGLDFKDERINVLYDCLDNIRQEVAVLPSLKIMKKLIDHYPTSPASAEKFTKSTCIDHLCKEKGLLGLIIEDLKALKAELKTKTENVKVINEQVLDSLVGDRTSYINHITERMQFIHYLLTNNSSGEVTLNYELLSDLWDVIVNNALIPGERDVVYKWIKEVAESKSGFPMSIEDLQKFFKEKMNSKDNKDCQAMTKEGFKCFKNVFLVINEKLQKISKVVVAASNNSYSSLYGGYGGSSYYYSTKEKEDTSKKEDEFDYTVNVLPNELEGIESIWDFILIAEEDSVAEKAIDFLNKLFLHVNSELESKIVEIRKEYLDTCNQQLKETLELQKSLSEAAFANRCIRCLRLISSIMDESEKQGVGNLKSHSGLVKGELLTFTVNNDVSTGSDVQKKTELRMYSNATVFDLRTEIAKIFKTSWDSVKLLRRIDPKEIKDNENGRTLREIRLRNSEVLTAAKRPTPPIPQAALILPDDTLNPIAKKIFLEWFADHSTNSKMNPDQCAAFIHSCTNDNCKAEDKRVKDVFTTYDDDKDGFLTEENFVKFYQMACKQRPPVVWNNLHSHHYRNDLKKVTEVEQEKVDITSLARYIIGANDEYFQLIFSLLGFGGKIAIEAWKLLNRLPTSPQVFSDIVMLKGIREKGTSSNIDWNSILDLDSKYKLLYALHVIEYLMEDDETDEEEEEDEGQKQIGRLLSKDPKLLEYKKTWQADFIAFGGFDHLFKIFNIFAKQDSSKLKMFDKNILSFVLKILKNYLSAAFAATVPNIYRNLSFIRLFYLSLDFIQDYLNSEHTRPSRENSFKLSQETGEPVLADARPRAGSKSQIEQGKLPRKDSKAEEKKKEKLKIEESEEFATLVDRLRGDLGSKILSTVNLKDLLEVISSLGFNILSDSGDLESEDRMILEYSLSILMAILFFNEEYIKYFLNPENSSEGHQGADKYMLEGVFCPKVVNIRKYFSHAIYVLCRHTVRFQNAFASKYFINLFLNNLPSSADSAKKDCNQYFELLCKLIEETYINDKRPRSLSSLDDNSPLDFKNLLDKVIQQLRGHISTEQRNNLNITDKILVGLLNLCEKILTVQPDLRNSLGSQGHHNLVEEIFNVCLFDVQERDGAANNAVALVDSKNYVKCKSKESRSIAYKLLIALCKDHETNMLTLLQCMKNLTITIVKLNTNKGWGYSPSSDTKSPFGYVGIKNLGCICYMNAMLQQFFMTPSFRYALLAADDKKEPLWVKKEKFTADDNVLHQLQQMFGFLELSDRQDYNPQEFCFAFKDHAGQPVNVSVQQDTQEFLNMIFDKLEHGLKQTPFRHILEGVYGGKTSNQVICGGCGTMREREDIFYNLSVEVKNLKTVYDSFEKFITGETIDDYFCDTCKKKNSITKRTCLSDLPNVLIIHLQRIVFDLDTLMNQKINTRLEFPSQLNVEPYTKEGLDWREKQKKKSSPTKKKEGAAEMGSGEKLRSNKQASEGNDKKDEEPDEVEIIDDEEYEIIDDKEGSAKKTRKPKAEEDEVLGPYMKHPKEYYEYRLAGVVVHVGTADFGHYYSYINTNRGDASKNGNDTQKNDRWLEYNDSLIKDFDAKDIEAECFGGAGSDSSDDYWSWGKVGREYSKNAYILVYERVLKEPLKLVVKTPEDKQDLTTIFELDKPEAEKKIKIEKATIGEGEDKQEVENYFYDYYQLERYVSPKIYKNVWEDNHKFMFERHIYTDDFFRFVKEVCNTLKIPDEVYQQQAVNFINPKHTSLSTEVKQSIGNLINILGVLVFYLLARAHDNNTIPELAEKLKQFLSLNPEAAWTLFDHFVCQDLKNVLELFLNCPEKQVRSATSQLILYTINVLISHYKLNLNLSKPTLTEEQLKALPEEQRHLYNVEESIVRFLDTLISYIPTEVAKNWVKFSSFLEFWRDFSVSGESQMHYLYQKNFITVLIDFYLGSSSPVPEFSEKKHTIGNRYSEPEFSPLIQTVANMVKRSRVTTKTGAPPYTSLARQGYPVYELSPTDMKCLFCAEFYEKALRDKSDKNESQSFGHIIQHFSFENEGFSQTLAEIILKGLNRSNYDDVKPYLEAMSYFISLNDMFQLKRIEWILGYPQPLVSTMRYGSDSFGMYGNGSLEDLVVSYETPLSVENSTSLINLVLQNRKKFENLCISIVRQLLILLDVNHVIFQYVVSLPPPSYNYAKFTDWIPAFIEYFLIEAKKYHYSTYSKEEIGLEAQKYWKSVEEKIKVSVDATRKAWDQVYSQVEGLKSSDDNKPAEPIAEINESKPDEAVESAASKKTPLTHIFKPYLIGQTFKEEELGKKIFESSDVPNEVSLVTLEAQCYITESKPLGVGNQTFPEYMLSDNRLRAIEVDNDSPFALFVQPKGVYEGGKNPMQSDIEAALKNSKGKEHISEPELREPLLQDDVDSDKPEGKNEQRSEKQPATNVVEGSSGTVEILDKEEGEIVPKGAGTESQQEHIDGQDKNANKKEEPIKERKREKEDVIELERVVPCQEDFNFVYELNPVVRRFVFHNTSPYNLLCQVRIVPKSNDFLNFRVPASTFRVKVRPQSNACVLAIMKILPEVAWGDYEVECDVSKVEAVGGAKNEPENGGRRKNVQFHIRTIEGAGGYSRDVDMI